MIERYRLLQSLGRGSIGEVWLAEDTRSRRQVAVKLLDPVMRTEKEYLRAFADEARVATSLKHPHMLPVHDFGELAAGEEIITYLIMPLMSGGSLQTLLRNRPGLLPVDTSLKYLQQAAEAIDFMHRRQVLHRNIKPANLLLQNQNLFLADFGIARLLSTETYRSRTIVGADAPAYMAPEQAQGNPEPASDRYSLAVIAYELLTGRVPFQNEDPFAVLLKHMQEPPPPPRQFNSQIPEAMQQIMLKGLAKQPEARPSSCQAFVSELTMFWRLDPQAARALLRMKPQDPEGTILAPWNKRALANEPTMRAPLSGPPALPPSSPGYPTSASMFPSNPQQPSSPPAVAASPQQPFAVPDASSPPSTTNISPAGMIKDLPRTLAKLDRRSLLIGGAGAAVFLAGAGFALTSTLYRAIQHRRTGPQQLMAGSPVLKLASHFQLAQVARWHPGGNYLATAGGADGRVLLWDIAGLLAKQARTASQPAAEWRTGHYFQKNELDWSPDGKTLAMITDGAPWGTGLLPTSPIATLDVFAPNAQPVLHIDHSLDNANNLYRRVDWSPTGDTLLACTSYIDGADAKIALWQPLDTTKQGAIKVFQGQKPQNQPPAFSPLDTSSVPGLCWFADGSQILLFDQQFTILSMDIKTGQMTELLTLPQRSQALPEIPGQNGHFLFPAIIASPAVPTQFAALDVDTVVIFDAQQQKGLNRLGSDDPDTQKSYVLSEWSSRPLCPQITQLAWSPNGRYLAGAYMSSTKIFIWDLQDAGAKITQDGLQLPALAFGKTGGHNSGECILDLTWSPDGRYLASSATDGTVIIWKVDAS